MKSRNKKILAGGLTLAIVIIASMVLVVLFTFPLAPSSPGGSTSNQWTWLSGSDSRNNPGIYGTKGVADSANVPGSRAGAASWMDASGNFWLFGGYGYNNASSMGRLNDLWRFNVNDATWTWMSGNYSKNNPGIYGTQGVADSVNVPGARNDLVSWMDADGNFWLFGGYGYDNTSSFGYLNDLWRFNVSDATWTWMSGNYSIDNPGIYGTQGVADSANMPGARAWSTSAWSNANGNLWLFGGWGYDNASLEGDLNDLWRFNVSDATWTWVSGNYSIDNPGIYGTQGVADSANVPGGRDGSLSSTDASGNFWLFGGWGYDNASLEGDLNDLWRFNVSDATWTWMSGNYSIYNPGIYGTQGVVDSANVPGTRSYTCSWMDASGNFWLFGGQGFDNTSSSGYLNDLWRFNVSDATWTWMSGNYSKNNPGIYGTKGVANSANVPGARRYTCSWMDASGNLWLFGGNGYDNASNVGYLNDLWKYIP